MAWLWPRRLRICVASSSHLASPGVAWLWLGVPRRDFAEHVTYQRELEWLSGIEKYLWFSGFMVLGGSGFLAFWISRFLASWISALSDFWISGFLDLQISGFLDFCLSAFLAFWISRFLHLWFPVF